MAEESEKRFHAVMDKLFLASPPNSKSTTTTASTSATAGGLFRGRKRPHTMPTALAIVDSKLKGGTIEELQNASGRTVQSPMCRPWDREDLLKRLATFKSMTWFAKPEVVSAINCVRRGWVNVDTDIIACESCGARLLFSTPSSWAQEQVEKAASVFSLKLNNGHKLHCPWVDNACDEKLAQFPPSSPADLVDSYKKRCASLLQLLELPVISSTAIDHMSSPLLEHFLKCPPALGNVNGHDNVSARGSGDEHEEVLPVLYYQAQKLISLCGWEPRLLPYIVDCKDVQDQSMKDGTLSHLSAASNAQNASITVYSSRSAENAEANQSPTGSEQYDHTSVVLDCRLCGAKVGLWAFRTTPRPAEFVRLIGHAELNEENEAACQMDDTNHPNVETSHAANGEQTASIAKSGTTSSSRSLLNLTIAGGPPPAEQDFRPKITLPVVGQNLRSRFASAFESVDGDQQPFKASSQVRKEHMGLVQETNEDAHHSATSNGSVDGVGDGGHMSVGGDVIMKTATSGTNKPYATTTTDQLEDVAGKSLNSGDNTPENLANVETVNTVTGDLRSSEDEGSSKKLDAENVALNHTTSLNNVPDTSLAVNDNVLQQNPVIDKNCDKQVNNRDCGVQTPGHPLKSSSAYLEKDSKQPSAAKAMELDPIKQHRHFCPWIASSGKSAPGWKQTLSALERQKEFIYPSATTQTSSSLIEVEDPVGSVKKLLTPPSAKRKKFTHGSS